MKQRDKEINYKAIFQSMPGIGLLVLPNSPNFTIVEATDALLNITQNVRINIIGKDLFEVFPDNPADKDATGVKNLKNSLDKVIATKQPHQIAVQRYDIENSNGVFEEFYWTSVNTPVINEQGEVIYIIHTSENVTEKILIEKHSKTYKENFDYYFNNAFTPFAIFIGEDFVFTFANPACVTLMHGRQLLGKSLEDAIPELKGQPFVSLLDNVFKTGIPFHTPEIAATALFYHNTELSTRYFNLTYIPYKNEKGIIEGVLASAYDITEEVELKRKEKKQTLNHQAYNLFMQAPVGFSLLKGDEHIVELANSTALNLTGKTEEILGKPIIEILPEIENQGYIDMLDQVKKYGKTFSLKESPVTLIKNGKEETLYVNLVYQPYYEGNDLAGVLSISTDVTELVLAKKESEELKERFETMSNNIPNLAWIANADGYIFWYNNRWYEYTGTTHKEMEGWGWQSVHDPEKLPRVLEQWKLSINTGKPFEMVFPLKGADNIFRPFLTRVIPVHDNEGKIIRWLGTNTDITKQKEVEQMKDDFLSIASHELKTPVTTIKAYGQIAESILEKKGDTETLAIIKRMGTQIDRLTNLIGDLLDITKMQKGKLIYKEAFFNFNELVKEVIDDMQKTTDTLQIKNNSKENVQIFGDKDKLSQVLNNIISNAIKYSPNADKIIVSTELKKDGIQLSVQDFGIGISADDQKKVFEQFYRVNDDKQATFPGMGIGLYISMEIIENHGGKIWIESTVGKGSTFYVWLPFNHREKKDT